MIYCCYPGTGKSYAAKRLDCAGEYRYDYPPKELRADKLSEEQRRALAAYCDARGEEIESLSKKYKYLFMQTDFRLFTALERRNIPYTIVIPDYRISGMKDEMLKRYIRRGTTSENFLEAMILHWDANMEAFEKKSAPKIYLKADQYLLDILK